MAGDGLREAAVEAMAQPIKHICKIVGAVERDLAAQQLDALLALLDQRGFAVVPVEPTQDMLRAAGKADDESAVGNGRTAGCEEHWDAMLAAAPNPLEAPDGC